MLLIAAAEEEQWAETNIIDVDKTETDIFYEDFIPPSPVPEETSPVDLSAPLNEPAQELKGIINAGFNFFVFNHLQTNEIMQCV